MDIDRHTISLGYTWEWESMIGCLSSIRCIGGYWRRRGWRRNWRRRIGDYTRILRMLWRNRRGGTKRRGINKNRRVVINKINRINKISVIIVIMVLETISVTNAR